MDETSMMYYWDEKNQVIIEQVKIIGPGSKVIEEMYCVDAYYTGQLKYRYGMYTKGNGWRTKEYSDFPVEFQMALLLLGVE